MVQNLSIDSGSSFMKAYTGPGPKQRVEFPAIVRELPESDLDGIEIKVNSKYYLVGHTAATSMNRAIRTPYIQEGFHGSIDQYVQMCFAMEQLGINGKMGKLICSLPYSDSRKKDLRRKLRERKTFVWSTFDSEDHEHERCVEFAEVAIVAQGVGAMELHMANDASERDNQAIMTVDVGSCTTDLVSIKLNDQTGNPEFCKDACTTIENANVNWFKDRWIENLKFVTRNISGEKRFDYYNLMRHAIQKDFAMQIGDRIIDAKAAFEDTKEEFTNFLKPQLMKAAGDLWDEANMIIFTGGGTYLINFDAFDDSRIQRMNQWANAKGQFEMFAKAAEATKGEGEEEPLPIAASSNGSEAVQASA